MRKIVGSRTRRTAVVLGAFGVMAAGGLTGSHAVAAPTASANTARQSQLGKHDRELLATARANRASTVTLLIAAVPGQNNSVTSALTALGAVISKADSDVSYIRAIVPIDKAQTAANLSGIVAADLDEVIPLDDPTPQGSQPATPQTPPGAGTPRNNAYMPIGDTGAAQFTAAHPTWDGRGTTIGIVDSGIDLDHPALATTTTGERKVTDWVTATDPFTDDDPTWLNMATQVNGPSFTVGGVTYAAPAGSYRFAVFNEGDPRLGGEVGSDVNRDGDSTDKFAVLWDPTAGTVRVDTNQDKNLSNDQVLTDYAKKFDVGHFGTDNPATQGAQESMPFVVQTDGKNKVVNIGIVSGEHGTHVAGITAANQMFGGAMSGAAPGAKLKSVRVCMFITGCTAHALIEGMTFIAKQGNVDVINMSIGGLPALNDGNNTRAVLYNRLIDQYNVQMFISAGNNGSGLNTIGDPAVASKVLAVGSYISKETWQKNYGSDSAFVDNLHGFSSRGPREDGGFKPEIVAPGAAISTTPMWEGSSPVAGTYPLPAGYSMLQGTSMASPQAAGVGALLVSAAKQAGLQSKPAQIREALTSSARQLDRYGAYEQGNGLINVGAAWDLLRTNLKPVDITSSVDVHTILSGFLATPGRGEGIFDRENVAVGDTYTRTYTFTRTSGGGGTRTYNLTWKGNDGTFEAPSSVVLPLNSPTTLTVSVHPTTAGTHSAILNLDDPTTAGIEKQTLNTVVAAEAFNAGNNYTVTHSGTIGRNQVTSYFYKVPANTPALKVDLVGGGSTAGTGQIRFLRFHPYGVAIDDNSSLSCYNPPSGTCTSGSPASRTTSNPQAGVWEVTVEARRTSDVENAPYTLTASILGARVSPNPDNIASATIGTPVTRSYTLTNVFGAFTGRAVGSTLGSALMDTPTVAAGAQQQRVVAVTAGSTSFRATIGRTSDPSADLDLYVYNCTTGSCVLAGQSADGDSEESVTIANPAAGTWVTLVDGYSVPAGSTTFNYVDTFTNPAFGAVSITDANAARPAGSSWTVPGAATVNAGPAAGRVLLGTVRVATDGNIIVGTGDVVVQAVTP